MKRSRKTTRRRLLGESLESRNLLAADPIISEFMAANGNTLFDGNGLSSDWIEIYNSGDSAVDLGGYALTDDATGAEQWTFPSTNLDAGEFLLVFASGDDEVDLAGNLHTDFKLSSSGDYLALIDPSGNTVSEFGEGGVDYAPQASDISYGLGFNTNVMNLVTPESASKYLVPTNSSVDAIWTDPGFDDSSWTNGTAAIGYENRSGYENEFTTELPVGTTTAYVRIPFNITEAASLSMLSVKYDDGFVAYLNGTQIASGNEPSSPDFESVATQTHDDAAAVTYVDFNLSAHGNLLNVGENVLSIRMLNRPVSSDFLAAVKLEAVAGDISTTGVEGALLSPTPGLPNSQVLAGDVTFSHDGGIFTSAFDVTLTTPDPSDVIRYTTNGTTPTVASPLYTDPINVSSSTRIRARAYGLLGETGRSFTESYTLTNSSTANVTSDLPIVVLENFGGGIPPKGPFRDGYLSIFEVDPATGRSSLANAADVSTKIGFHRRGSSTAGNPKPNLRVELRDDSGEDEDHSLAGLPSESDWVLYAPYSFDRAMLRDTFFMAASNQMGRYAPRTKFVEVYGNTNGGSLTTSDYLGVYILVETIKIDADRVDIAKLSPSDNSEPDVTGGFILKIDRNDGAPDGNWNSNRGNNYVHFDPERDELTQQQTNYIRDHINEFEDALYGPDSTDPELGYEAYFNVDESIDYHLIKTLSKDPDALRLSTYLYKDRNGKITYGPQWDFDRAAAPDGDGRAASPTGWDANEAPFFGYKWWGQLFRDADFEQRWIDRWQELRTTVLSDDNISAIIGSQADEIRESQVSNYLRWPAVSPNGGPFASPGTSGWEGEVSHLENWILARAAWMDSQMISRPSISPSSGNVAAGTQVVLSPANAGDTIYYTLDGSDPRGNDGAISPNATIYSAPFDVSSAITVTARSVRTGTRALSSWSGAITGVYASEIPASSANLRITELHFHPGNPSASELAQLPLVEDDDFEFIELANVSETPISLVGAQFTTGITFDFSDGSSTVLLPGERIVLVEDAEAFAVRYGDSINVGGQYSGNLANSGEQITLVDANGDSIHNFVYDDADPWPEIADGDGPSMVVVDLNGDYSASDNWRASVGTGGSPGGIAGDIDGDGQLTCTDVNAISSEAVAGAHSAILDVNGDGVVDANDVSTWVTSLKGARLGDANLDGAVDGIDFSVWSALRFTQTNSYCLGDFNTDGFVDASDFNIWNTARDVLLAQSASVVPAFDTMDVNRDGNVSSIDALSVINQINREPTTVDSYLDVNLDGYVSPIDALVIINYLNRSSAASVVEATEESTNHLDVFFSTLDDEDEVRP